MENVLRVIGENYIVIATVLILMLMIIIGYYAEKTNFGNKSIDKDDDNKDYNQTNNPENTQISFIEDTSNKELKEEKKVSVTKPKEKITKLDEVKEEAISLVNKNNLIKSNLSTDNEQFDLDKEFEKILFSRQAETERLNHDIKKIDESLSIPKTSEQVCNTNLDNLESDIKLPEIMPFDREENIWK